jgi:hypothetical protein
MVLQIANILLHKLYPGEGYELFFHLIPSRQYSYFHSYYQSRKNEVITKLFRKSNDQKSSEQPKIFKDVEKSSLDVILTYLGSLSSFPYCSSHFSISSDYGCFINDSFIEKVNSSSESDFYRVFSDNNRIMCHKQFPWFFTSAALLISTVICSSFSAGSDFSARFGLLPYSLSYLQSILQFTLPYIISTTSIASLEGLLALCMAG